MELFKQLSKKGYNHYYKGTIEELDSMDKDNQHLHCEIMQVVMWLYKKHSIWIYADYRFTGKYWHVRIVNINTILNFGLSERFNSPTEAYEAAILYTLNNLKNS